jgi:hypothetical protein
MRFVLFASITLLMLGILDMRDAFAQKTGNAAFYVAPNGNDSWSGKLAAPNAAKTDGPFATLSQAQQAVRTLPTASKNAGCRVAARGGFYSLTSPLSFDKSDSGTENATITYEAYKNETPVVSGGERLTGWKQTMPGRWEVTLPAVARGEWRFSQLYVNNERRLRPRLPKDGYYTIGGGLPATPKAADKGYDRFIYRKGDIDPNWQNQSDIEVLCFHIWSMSRFNIARIDPQERALTLSGFTRKAGYNYSLVHNNRYIVENVKEALSVPGQWYLDRKTGVLTYLSRPGEDPNRDQVIAPRQERLLEINGASHITFRGITFAHASWNLSPEGVRTGQAEIGGIPAALQLNGAQSVTFDNCTVHNIGNQAFGLGKETQYCRITGCTLQDMGGGGVLIGAENDAVPNGNHIHHNTVENCLIAAGGRIHSSAVGIWIGQSAYNTITHNEITDFYYSAISTGWTWGYAENDNHHNTITYNHLHNLGQGVLSDMGGVYTIGMSPGTVIDHNRIHDIVSYDYGGWGIYFDEGSMGISATNNVVYNLKSSPFHQHYGIKNLVENNILAFGNEAQIIRARGTNNKNPKPETAPDMRAESSFTLRRNIIYGRKAPFFSGEWSGENFTLADNLYWSVDPKMPARFPGSKSLSEWQAQNHDSGSLVADPKCADPAKGDFTLQPDSPASKIGFVPIDISTAGRLTGKPYTRKAPRAFPSPEVNRDYVADNFEDSVIGTRPSGLLAIVGEEGEDPKATVRITDETAATGKRSVKITDVAGQQNTWTPNLSYKLKLTQGAVTGRFALRLEPGAIVKHEWRDADSPFHYGPSLRIAADGTLTANEKILDKLPQGQWLNVTVTCALGTSSTGTYDLTIQGAKGTPELRYKNLTYDRNFISLRNWGFVSDTNGPSTFYLDDISLTVR